MPTAAALEEAFNRVAHGLKASADFAVARGPAALAGKAESAFRCVLTIVLWMCV